jgi:hypothetical protein
VTLKRGDHLSDLTERTLTVAEAEAYLSAPISEDERQHTLQLVEWFLRRYPTPIERLRYVTRAYRRWQRRFP